MTKVILMRELLDAAVSRKLLLVSVLCCLLMPMSILVNHRALDQFSSYQSQARADYERSLTGSTPGDQVEIRVFRDKAELSSFATGLEPLMPNSVILRAGGMSYGAGQAHEKPLDSLFGRIDLLFVVRFILSLAAIVLSFGLVSGEKEAGTLSLVLSNPVPRDSFLLGKYFGALVVLLVPFVFALLLSVVILQLFGASSLAKPTQWAAVGLIAFVSALYLNIFLSLGALVSTLTSRALTSMTILLFLWAGLVAVVPQSAGLLSELMFPIESAESVTFRKSLVGRDLDARRSDELQQYFGSSDYDELRRPVALKYAAELQETTARMDREFENKRASQFRLASGMAYLSPVTPLTLAFSTLAGSGVLQAQDFYSSLNRFRRQVNDEVFSQGYRDVGPNGQTMLNISLIDRAELPQFELRELPFSEVLRSIMVPVVVLVLINFILFMSAYLRFLRYDVR